MRLSFDRRAWCVRHSYVWRASLTSTSASILLSSYAWKELRGRSISKHVRSVVREPLKYVGKKQETNVFKLFNRASRHLTLFARGVNDGWSTILCCIENCSCRTMLFIQLPERWVNKRIVDTFWSILQNMSFHGLRIYKILRFNSYEGKGKNQNWSLYKLKKIMCKTKTVTENLRFPALFHRKPRMKA